MLLYSCPIEEYNDDEQEEYAVSTPPREPADWCEAGASAVAEWTWELQSQPILDFRFQILDLHRAI
jgi:hypothetical protein